MLDRRRFLKATGAVAMIGAATWLHNLFFVLFILAFIGHIGAILLKPNRPLARGIFTGAVRLDYARHRHPLWMAEIEKSAPAATAQRAPAQDPGEPPSAEATAEQASPSAGGSGAAEAMDAGPESVADKAAPATGKTAGTPPEKGEAPPDPETGCGRQSACGRYVTRRARTARTLNTPYTPSGGSGTCKKNLRSSASG